MSESSTPPESNTVLLCEPMRPIRERMKKEAEKAGLTVLTAQSGKEALQSAAQNKPDLVLLSSAVSDVHMENLLRAFQLSEHTKTIPVVVTTDEVLKSKIKSIMEMGAAECVRRAIDSKAFIKLFEIHLKKILVSPSQLKRQRATTIFKRAQLPESQAPAEGEKVSPLMVRMLLCPLHSDAEPFESFALRTRSQNMEPNQFDIPVFSGGLNKYFGIPYLLYETHICPDCFYASSDMKFFSKAEEDKNSKPVWQEKIRESLKAGRDERLALLTCEPVEVLGKNRSVDGGLVALRCAKVTSAALFEFDPKTYAVELYRQANYCLRMHQVLIENDRLDEIEEPLTEAYTLLEKAFPLLEGPVFYRLCYQLIALGVYFEKDSEVRRYIDKFRKVTGKGAALVEHEAVMQTYQKRLQAMWEDRDEYRQKTNPTKED